MRRDCCLASLTRDQLDDLYEWISNESYLEVVKRVALPAPDGFGIKTHITTLCRFYREERARRHAESLIEARNAPDPLTCDELVAEASRQLAHASYEIALGPINAKTFNDLSRALHRKELTTLRLSQVEINKQQLDLNKERIALERKRIELEVRQFEHNAVEAAAKHAAKLNEIGSDPNLDDRQKYALARDVVFGASEGGSDLTNSRNRREEILTTSAISSSGGRESSRTVTNPSSLPGSPSLPSRPSVHSESAPSASSAVNINPSSRNQREEILTPAADTSQGRAACPQGAADSPLVPQPSSLHTSSQSSS